MRVKKNNSKKHSEVSVFELQFYAYLSQWLEETAVFLHAELRVWIVFHGGGEQKANNDIKIIYHIA